MGEIARTGHGTAYSCPRTLPDTIARRRQTVATCAKIVEFERPIILQTSPAARKSPRRAASPAPSCRPHATFPRLGMYSCRMSRCVTDVGWTNGKFNDTVLCIAWQSFRKRTNAATKGWTTPRLTLTERRIAVDTRIEWYLILEWRIKRIFKDSGQTRDERQENESWNA